MSAHRYLDRLDRVDPVTSFGAVERILPTAIEASGPNVALGTLCRVESRAGGKPTEIVAETVQLDRRSVRLVPLDGDGETFVGARITALGRRDEVPVGDALLGRAVDGLARPIDGAGPLADPRSGPLFPATPSPLDRCTPRRPLVTGIRAIDGFLPIGQGQRVGIFAAAGVGKTALLAQLARQARADICILCLVGERGREVEAFWSKTLNEGARAHSVLVAATSNQSAAMRVRATDYALALAAYWRAQGRNVLLLLDSITRLAMALREIGLAAGEPPTVRAYTPGVFAAIPRIVEQCGALRTGGSITALMTVLCETDDLDDPIAETMKALLDGHILLSRDLAQQRHFPALDVPGSISRLAGELLDTKAAAVASRLAGLLGRYEMSRVLIETGIYQQGGDAEIDAAIAKRPAILDFLAQSQDEASDWDGTRRMLAAIDAS